MFVKSVIAHDREEPDRIFYEQEKGTADAITTEILWAKTGAWDPHTSGGLKLAILSRISAANSYCSSAIAAAS